MSEYTPRNPDAYYGHPLGAYLMKGAAYAPYFDSAGRFLVGRIVEEVIDSKWLAQHDAEVERAAAEKAWDEAARVAVSAHAYRGGVEQWAGREIAKAMRTRADEYRREEA